MSDTLEFILALKDKFSTVAEKFTSSMEAASAVTNKVTAAESKVTSAATAGWSKVTAKIKSAVAGSRQLGSSLEGLRNKLTLVQGSMAKTTDKNAFRFYYEEAKKLERQIRRLEQGITGSSIGSKLAGWRNDFANSLPGAGLMKNPLVGAGAAMGGLWTATEKAMEAGKEKMKMQVLTGSEEIGASLYDGLTKFATDTVFGSEVYDMGAQMLANGISDADVLPLMKQLGDISMGDAEKLGSLSLAFSQINSAGKLTGQDLLQMINAGFNPLQVISEKTGESISSLKEKMSKGLITIDDVKEAMNIATGEGGKFNGMLEKVAATPYGQLEGLRGELDQMMISIGDTFLPIASKLMSVISWLGEKAGPYLKPFAVVLGAVSAALLVLAAAQWVANLAVWAFPGTWIVLAIVALIAAIVWLVSKVSGWGDAWDHTMKGAKLIFQAFVATTKAHFGLLVNSIMIGIDKIRIGWLKFKEFVGLGDSQKNQELLTQLNQDVEDRKKAIVEGYKKAGKLSAEAISEFVKAGQSFSWDDSSSFKNPLDNKIDLPTGIPGAKPNLDEDKTKKGKKSAQKTNTAIATGGTKHNYITITLKQLVENINISGKDFRETTNQMEEQVLDALLRLTASATTAGG